MWLARPDRSVAVIVLLESSPPEALVVKSTSYGTPAAFTALDGDTLTETPLTVLAGESELATAPGQTVIGHHKST